MEKINAKKKESTANQKKAAREYNKRSLKQIKFYLHKDHDKAMIEHLQSQYSTSAYIKNLIDNDMKGGEKENDS